MLCYVLLFVLCCAVLCSVKLCCVMLCCVALFCIVLRCFVLCYAVLCCYVLHCVVLCCAVLCYVMLCCFALCCVVLCCVVFYYVLLCSFALCCFVLCCVVLCYVITILSDKFNIQPQRTSLAFHWLFAIFLMAQVSVSTASRCQYEPENNGSVRKVWAGPHRASDYAFRLSLPPPVRVEMLLPVLDGVRMLLNPFLMGGHI